MNVNKQLIRTNKKMDETRDYINLVLTVKKYPVLYDLSCNDYHNKIVRNKMWEAVAQEVSATAAECKDKWKNLRASYSRHLRNKISGNSKSKKPYYMASYMDFLLPYSKVGKQDNSNKEDTLAQETWNDEEVASNISSSYEKSNKFDQKNSLLDKESDTRIEEHSFLRNKAIKFTNDKLLSQRSPENYILSNIQELEEAFNDPDWLFLKSILPDIHQMTSPEKRTFKISVLSLIVKILNGKESSTSIEASNSVTKIQQDEEGG